MGRVYLKDSDLEITHVKGSGPGGQHRNKRETGVRIHHIPSGLTVRATDDRSQTANLRKAKERLRERLEKRLAKPKKRKPTKVTRGAKERRLKEKSKHGDKKKLRGSVRRNES